MKNIFPLCIMAQAYSFKQDKIKRGWTDNLGLLAFQNNINFHYFWFIFFYKMQNQTIYIVSAE